MEENKPVVEEPSQSSIPEIKDKEQLLNLLTQKQKKALGLLPPKYQSEKAKARNEMLRERMKKINEERKENAKKAVKGVIVEKPKKRKVKEPSEEESEETSSEDQVIQKRAKKVDETIKHLTKVEQRLQSLQNHHNPFMRLVFK